MVPAAETLRGSIPPPAARLVPGPSTVRAPKTEPGASREPAVNTVFLVTVTALLKVSPFFPTAVPFNMLPVAIKLPASNSLFATKDMACPIRTVPFTVVLPARVVFPAITIVPPTHRA